MQDPVPLWEGGEQVGEVDAATPPEDTFIVDLGETWTPVLFTDGVRAAAVPEGEVDPLVHRYRTIFLDLARGEFPEDHHGDRARRDEYLELYGIPPTLALLRERYLDTRERACGESVDRSPLTAFEGFLAYRRSSSMRTQSRIFVGRERAVQRLLTLHGVERSEDLPRAELSRSDGRDLDAYIRQAPRFLAVRAVQERLRCEGFFEGEVDPIDGQLDWATHEALAKFERRNRLLGWGFINAASLELLRLDPEEVERRGVLRVLTERALHDAGVIEDGSATPRSGDPVTYTGADGEEHEVRDLQAELQTAIIDALGLQTADSTLRWLESLGELEAGEHRRIAVRWRGIPEYYSDDMDLAVEIDRGDIWYEFPYDAQGRERSQPTTRRPRTTLFVNYRDQRIPIASYGTTVGGWRTEFVEGRTMWRYKNSPTGDRFWHRVVSAPVWLPPASTPPSSLLERVPRRRNRLRPNYHETGPSYASAYGLVAAYHARVRWEEDGGYRTYGDQGIRSHGSVDYMSIARRHSHGCHRLHNHIAVRMMSFVVRHRRHQRNGHENVAYRLPLEHEGETYILEVDEGGYEFRLERPIPVSVLTGRILGRRGTPIIEHLPLYDDEAEAYVMPDGQHVTVSRAGVITPVPMPADAGIQEQGSGDAGVALDSPPVAAATEPAVEPTAATPPGIDESASP